MNDFVSIFTVPVAVVWGIFALLSIYACKKGLSFTRLEKRSFAVVLIVLASVLGCFFFFEETGFVFSCRKSTQRCDYFHSTLYNQKLRLKHSYDLTDMTQIEIVPHKRSCGRYCRKTVYRIRFHGNGDGFEMPKDFDLKEDAEEQASKAADFIQTDKPRYVYKDIMPDGAGKNLMIVMVSVMSMVFALNGVFTLLIKLFKKNILLKRESSES